MQITRIHFVDLYDAQVPEYRDGDWVIYLGNLISLPVRVDPLCTKHKRSILGGVGCMDCPETWGPK